MRFHMVNRYQWFRRSSTQFLGIVHANQQRQSQAWFDSDRNGVQIVQTHLGLLQCPGHDIVDVLLVQISGHWRNDATETADNIRIVANPTVIYIPT